MPGQVKWAISFLVGAGLIVLGWRVPYLLAILHVLVCFLLVVVVLLQSGKAADLAGAFGGAGSQTAFGPRGAATFLSRATTWCAIVFMMTSLTLSFKRSAPSSGVNSILNETSTPGAAPAPSKTPAPPIQIPVQPAPQSSTPAPNSTPQK
jgi:preprotein translocase subunit SecG